MGAVSRHLNFAERRTKTKEHEQLEQQRTQNIAMKQERARKQSRRTAGGLRTPASLKDRSIVFFGVLYWFWSNTVQKCSNGFEKY